MLEPAPVAVAVAALVASAEDRLAASGSTSPRLDAELLLAHAVGTDRTGILAHPEAPVGDGPRAAFEALVARRELGEPVAYLRGFREFHGLAIATDERALIPRPETELLVDAALEAVSARLTAAPRPAGSPPLRVADVGTGSGAIAVALVAALRRRRMADQVIVDAIDVSPDALQLARENAAGHGVADRMTFTLGDLLPERVLPSYAVICANLPYVATRRAGRAGGGPGLRAARGARRRPGRPRRHPPAARPAAGDAGRGRGGPAGDRGGPGRGDRARGGRPAAGLALRRDAGPRRAAAPGADRAAGAGPGRFRGRQLRGPSGARP